MGPVLGPAAALQPLPKMAPLLFSGAAMRSQPWARSLPTQGAQAGGPGCTEGKVGGMQPLWEWWHCGPVERGHCSTPKLNSMTPLWPC